MVNKIIIERVYLDDKRLRPQTIHHHVKRYMFATEIIDKEMEKTLDLACGSGYGTLLLSVFSNEITGVDISKEAIEYAKKHYHKPTFLVGDVTKIKPKRYNLITFFEAIEHLPFNEGQELLKKIATKMMAKDGIFIMSTPRKNNGKYNTFHKSEWSYDLIKNTLGSLFKEVTIWGQDWDTGIISLDHVVDNDFYIAVCKI